MSSFAALKGILLLWFYVTDEFLILFKRYPHEKNVLMYVNNAL